MDTHPYDFKAERALLGTFMADPNILLDFDAIEPAHFYHRPHQHIFEAIQKINQDHQKLDYITLQSKLKNLSYLEAIGGEKALMELTEDFVSSAFAEDYYQIVMSYAKSREIIKIGEEVQRLGKEFNQDPEAVKGRLEKIMLSINKIDSKNGFVATTPILKGLLDGLAEGARKPGEISGVTTGYPELDDLLLGMRAGQMIVLAARPSIGKSALALCLALNAVKKQSIPVGFISLEMSAIEVMERAVAITANINLRKIKMKDFHEQDLQNIGKAINEIEKYPLFICDQGGLTLGEIRSRAIKQKMESGLGLLVIDYIGLIKTAGRFNNMVHEIGEISMGIKSLAKELEIPIIVLSQLNRQIENRDSKEPRLADIKDSGSIEQDADIVMFIDRHKEHNPDQAKLYLKKNRGGELGLVEMKFVGGTTAFTT
jgi:replicative DNA helicase